MGDRLTAATKLNIAERTLRIRPSAGEECIDKGAE